uniref:Uncharacterized protein n=1 Tax=Anguilla anguilla TaxID=7936 RepID=A0A0E9T5D9_ANGAN
MSVKAEQGQTDTKKGPRNASLLSEKRCSH